MTKPLAISRMYIAAETRRQRYLDYITENPGVIATEIQKHMIETYGDKAKTTNTTRTMCAMGELRTAPAKPQGYRYYATANKTISAREMAIRHREANDRINEAKRNGAKPLNVQQKNDEPWLYRNRPDHPDHVAPTNQGGQGALRARVYVGASEAMI